jgi:alkanesulfonate monooxygenase SsuD/methylene tetrahydromethanopterin reductase-like flavin-dependent oxidoreductase (luciferase family)
MRPPAVLARSAARLDILSGGRFELGLGAGHFFTAIEAMGGPHLTPGEAVTALDEAIQIIRVIGDTDARGGIRFDGRHYRLAGAKRGPRPAHDIGIWVGAYKPRMLRLTGRAADGWWPSLPVLRPGGLITGNAIIDEAAVEAGRSPHDVRRLLNLGDELPAEEIAALALDHGVSAFSLEVHNHAALNRLAHEIAPAVP